MARPTLLLRLLTTLSWRELRHQPLRHALAVLAVALGVALAYAVQLINASALAEFAGALRQVHGEPDLVLRADGAGGFDEAWYARIAADPRVALASPLLELDVRALDRQGRPQRLTLLGVDALTVAALSPALRPQPADPAEREALFDPDALFLNAAAQRALGVAAGDRVPLQSALALRPLRVAGAVVAPGAALAVIDLAGAQQHFDRLGRLDRIDLRLVAGADADTLRRDIALPAGLRLTPPGEATRRLSQVSRAYRVNLTALALVALFTGSFLVFSMQSLSVAQRQPQFALLGVLGLGARERAALLRAEALLIGGAGSVLGLALGAALAWAALRLLGGDLGGGYFGAIAPSLQLSPTAAALHAALGVAAAVTGGWLPARAAARLAPAQALKGLGGATMRVTSAVPGLALMVAGALLALLPPIDGLPLAAYAAVALLLTGGIVCVPAAVGLLLERAPRRTNVLWLLASERARRLRASATVAVAGVVASLSLAVALTVMVTSFRAALQDWLTTVLPADLYVRTAGGAAAESAWLPPELVAAAAALPGVARAEPIRALPVALGDPRPGQPGPTLIARPLADPARSLPLLGEPVAPAPGTVSVYASEALAQLHRVDTGQRLDLVLARTDGQRVAITAFVRGIWRDYARQQGALVMAEADYRALTGDTRVNDLALTLAPGADLAALQRQLRALAPEPGLLEFASAGEIRAQSLRIFDRSFAVTWWLQAVAIAIGLVGIAASFSAQVLARRKEFGLLAHLGFTRHQVLAVVAGEGLAWTGAGALLGLALGVAVSVVLVHVVNPQSFHWSMELLLPWGRLAALAGAVLVAGTLTAALAARHAVARNAVLAVREDW
ncbi:MAG TPA: ABC transporter permease [Methylibium sp.]|nr:ABC transporter permease [Methylibium sp.]